jgi:hypothetical protein
MTYDVLNYDVGQTYDIVRHDIRCRMLSSSVRCTTSYAIWHTISHTMVHLIQIVRAKLPVRWHWDSIEKANVYIPVHSTLFRPWTPQQRPAPPHQRWQQRRWRPCRITMGQARLGSFDCCNVISCDLTTEKNVYVANSSPSDTAKASGQSTIVDNWHIHKDHNIALLAAD